MIKVRDETIKVSSALFCAMGHPKLRGLNFQIEQVNDLLLLVGFDKQALV